MVDTPVSNLPLGQLHLVNYCSGTLHCETYGPFCYRQHRGFLRFGFRLEILFSVISIIFLPIRSISSDTSSGPFTCMFSRNCPVFEITDMTPKDVRSLRPVSQPDRQLTKTDAYEVWCCNRPDTDKKQSVFPRLFCSRQINVVWT